jgi:fatty-acyl-CoA synthase
MSESKTSTSEIGTSAENALTSRPDVLEDAAVLARHEKWGEGPVASVSLREGGRAGKTELIGFARTW